MALTQTARIPGPGPSWDEEVVPALRKRLESESRTLSRRLSTTLMPPDEDYQQRNDTISSYTGGSNYNTNQSYQNGATYTPRPSQQSQNNSDQNAHERVNVGSSSATRRPSRSRTRSQPYKSDYPKNRTKVNGAITSSDTLSSLHPIAPSTSVKPSRIPQPSRTRTASLSSNNFAPFLNGTGSASAHTSPYSSPLIPHVRQASASDLSKVQETSSQSTVSVITKQRSDILNEQPPFKSGSRDDPNPSNESLYDDRPRMSTESQERPFEHWYRGDVSRNGGVGELRVVKRQEMMEIANYGHTLKPNPNKPAVRNAITDAIDNRKRRRRADSAGDLVDRTSFYMDEEQAENVGRVLDENPLTDVEGEISNGEDYDIDYYLEEDERYRNKDEDQDISIASAPLPNSSDPRSTTPTPNYSRPSSRNQNLNSRIPVPRAITPTPSQYQRGASEPPSLQHSSTAQISSPPALRSKQQTQQLRSTSTSPSGTRPGNRGVSPNTPGPSSAKRTRITASKATQAKLAAARKKEIEEEETRRKQAGAAYPDPGNEEDMAHAIPTWTQPVPNLGNWDEVVLPTVARKKGLADQYQQADGSPKVKHGNSIAAPAPGTFGYDHSKYRPPRSDGGGELIPMDEFGRPQEEPDARETLPPIPDTNDQFKSISELQHQHQPPQLQQLPHRPYTLEHTPSPVPYLHGNHATAITDTKEAQQEQQQHLEKEEAGCCKCVVM